MLPKLLITGIAAICFFVAHSQESHISIEPVTAPKAAALPLLIYTEPAVNPQIESILANKAVKKEQLSNHAIQAIGTREGATHFIIHFYKEKLHGSWQTFYPNQQLRDSGTVMDNLPHGEWKTWYPSGQLESVRHYSATKYHFVKNDVRRNHPKDQKYAITRQARASKNIDGYFQPRYDGATAAHSTAPLLQKIQSNTGSDAAAYIPPFNQALHHGVFINYLENGAVKDSGFYKNGVKEGLWTEAHTGSSEKAVGYYHNGLKKGQWKYYDRHNRLLYTHLYSKKGALKEKHHFKK